MKLMSAEKMNQYFEKKIVNNKIRGILRAISIIQSIKSDMFWGLVDDDFMGTFCNNVSKQTIKILKSKGYYVAKSIDNNSFYDYAVLFKCDNFQEFLEENNMKEI